MSGNERKLALFRRHFTGRTDVYGTYDTESGLASQVKQPVTHAVLLAHLYGHRPYGVYLLVADRVGSAAVDFDTDDLAAPIECVAAARQYGLPVYIERSKKKGYHVWIFFEEGGVLAGKARLVLRHLLAEINMPQTEIFPKQDRLDDRTCYGNFINAPLFGRLVPQGRTVFVDPSDPTKPCKDHWDFLEQIQTVSEQQLDEIIEINDLRTPSSSTQHDSPVATKHSQSSWFPLPACARRILAEGVSTFQRVVCFRLAVHLKKAGVPQDLAVALLSAWASKNRPSDGKRIIANDEITDQVGWAYDGGYQGCGCEEPAIAAYCSPKCMVWSRSRKTGLSASSPGQPARPVAPHPVSRSDA